MKLPLLKKCVAITGLALLLLFCLNCGGGGGDGTTSEDSVTSLEKGELVIGLTDADGDFTAYQVDVVSIKLYREDGAEISVLPVASTIDFTEYIDVTELLSTTSLSKGRYVSGNMVLDYSQHDVQIEVSGNSVTAEVIDSLGDPIDQIEMSFNFGAENLEITKGSSAFLSLDFDLQATNEVDLSGETPTVTVTPLLIAEINGESFKQQRTRGLLTIVDTSAQTFEMKIRPLKTNSGSFGSLTVEVDENTLFDVDGGSFIGLSGLSALEAVDLETLVTVTGNLNLQSGFMEADMVSAGNSVLGNAYDFGKGSVVAIEGNVLTLRGGTLKRHNGAERRGGLTYVELGDLTEVTKSNDLSEGTVEDLLIGSQILVYGEASTESGNRILENVQNVKLHDSELQGEVVSIGVSSLMLNIQSINGRDVSIFPIDTPEMFLISTASLDLSSLEVNDLLKIEGYFSSSSEFDAMSILDVSNVGVKASISWTEELSGSPLLSVADMNAVISLNEEVLSRRHHIYQGRLKSDLLDHGSSLNLFSPTDMGSFTLSFQGESTPYTSFNDFMEALDSALTESSMKSMSIKGEFDSDSVTFTVESLRVLLR
jgi:hypothetical protein